MKIPAVLMLLLLLLLLLIEICMFVSWFRRADMMDVVSFLFESVAGIVSSG